MSLRTTQVIVPAGTAPTFSATTASDTMEVGDRLFAVYRSAHSATVTVTVLGEQVLENGDVAPNKSYTLAIGSTTMQEKWIPLFKSYHDATTGLATITCSPLDATITMAVVRR
ncbi:hypothetical protein DMA15_03520 [Streptomyces sp. WAC 01529]|uniref:hypothetical protein n=1 Tax=Streptomyces sp. WAC 01529 TaxID=2203205 RepID=UPI000F6E6D26|nr:hypothetical protein [Streptomyces sp. WAC 01529]AZM51762.1 hypothetical protein DMA15_03520 [Streptomyces sp. WAC 01529]